MKAVGGEILFSEITTIYCGGYVYIVEEIGVVDSEDIMCFGR